ncbi:MAG: hypothetical protein JRI80_12495 [Deltaproteobacteria bacterium]|nr:hypothetical protein [Deltaproteobacteria bacterium]
MARLARNTEIYENGLAELARRCAIEDWNQHLRPLAFQEGGYYYRVGYNESQSSEFDKANDNARDTLPDTRCADHSPLSANNQTSTKSEYEPSIIDSLLPFFRKKTVENELRGYLRLEAGWGGVNSVAVPELAVENAISFLNRFPDNLTQPTPMIAADGEVGLYWRYQSAYVELEFAGDGLMFGYCRDLNGNEEFIDDLLVDSFEQMEEAIAVVSKIVSEFSLDDD